MGLPRLLVEVREHVLWRRTGRVISAPCMQEDTYQEVLPILHAKDVHLVCNDHLQGRQEVIFPRFLPA